MGPHVQRTRRRVARRRPDPRGSTFRPPSTPLSETHWRSSFVGREGRLTVDSPTHYCQTLPLPGRGWKRTGYPFGRRGTGHSRQGGRDGLQDWDPLCRREPPSNFRKPLEVGSDLLRVSGNLRSSLGVLGSVALGEDGVFSRQEWLVRSHLEPTVLEDGRVEDSIKTTRHQWYNSPCTCVVLRMSGAYDTARPVPPPTVGVSQTKRGPEAGTGTPTVRVGLRSLRYSTVSSDVFTQCASGPPPVDSTQRERLVRRGSDR